MKRKALIAALVMPLGLAWAVGCTGDDELVDTADGGTAADGAVLDSGPVTLDGSILLGCGDAGGAPLRALVTGSNTKTSELAVVNVASKAVDGRLSFDSDYGVTWSHGTDPYLLAQTTDIVSRLDAQEPWKLVSSWSVRGDDRPNGAAENANPSAVVAPSCEKAYVLRFNRNKIAVLSTVYKTTTGTPTGFIDLSSLVQASDTDGVIEMTGAVYVASKNRVYVLLGNTDLKRTVKVGFETKLVCANSTSSIIAIDPATDAVVGLGGSAPGGGIALGGYNPPLGSSFVYDAALDRLLVLSAGCNADVGDGGPGAIVKRRVEAVSLATGQVTVLLDLSAQGFPSGLAYGSGTQAALGFFGAGNLWNPQTTSLGAPFAIDSLADDGHGNVLGTSQAYLDGGAPGPLSILTVPYDGDGGGMTTVTTDPFTKPPGYVSGVEVWPHP